MFMEVEDIRFTITQQKCTVIVEQTKPVNEYPSQVKNHGHVSPRPAASQPQCEKVEGLFPCLSYCKGRNILMPGPSS